MASERISDEDLADVARRVADGRCAVCLNGKTRSSCVACDGTGAFNLATDVMERILLELIALRASSSTREMPGMTSEQVATLTWLRHMLAEESFNPDQWKASIDVLDKIIGTVAIIHGQDDGSIRRVYMTGNEMEALAHVRRVYPNATGMHHDGAKEAVAVLDKLLAGTAGGGK